MDESHSMTAKEKLHARLDKLSDDQIQWFEDMMETALPEEFRASRKPSRFTESVGARMSHAARQVDDLTDDEAQEVEEYFAWAAGKTDTLSDDELEEVRKGDAEIARGEYVTYDEVRRKLGL